MTASERIRAARESDNSLVSALDQTPVETRKDTFTLQVGRKTNGQWWARVEGQTHYAVGNGSDAWSAALAAVHEATYVIGDQIDD